MLAFGLGSCSATKQDGPEPASGQIIDGTHTQVLRMPNGFRNVVFTCNGTTGLYVTSRGNVQSDPQPSGIAVLAGDPKCRG